MTAELKEVYKLKDWVDEHFDGNQAACARAQKTTRSLVGQWVNPESGIDYIVVDGRMYLPRRMLNTEMPEDKGDDNEKDTNNI